MANNSVVTQEVLQNALENYHENFVYPYLNGATHTGFTPVGTVISYFGETAPEYFLICDGTEYAKSDYPQLADLLLNLTDPTPYEGSDSDHFKVPDLRGEFLRGTGTNGHTNQGNGANVGVHQNATQHVGVTPFGGERSFAVAEVNDISGVNPDSVITGNNFRRKYTYSSSSDLNQPNYYTARPTNTSVLYCIAYKNIYIDLALDSFPLGISNPTDGQALVWNGTEGRWKNAGILHEYSTDEKVVGTWIDGKPLYEKVLVGAIPTTSTDGVIVSEIVANLPSDAKNIVKFESIWWGDAGASTWSGAFPIIDKMYSAGLGFTNIFCGNDGSVRIQNAIQRYSGRRVYVTVQYIKTTD